jgi:hypothetical protein
MTAPAVNSKVANAANVLFDNTGTGIVAEELQSATVELDARSVFLRRKILDTSFTIAAGYFAVWHSLRIEETGTLRIEANAVARVLG